MGKSKWKNGKYTSTKSNNTYTFRSSWELRYMRMLDLDTNVISWDYECLKIPYMWWKKKRIYKPDFLVHYIDGSISLIEVKPLVFMSKGRNKAKKEAGELWCMSNNTSYKFASLADIEELENKLAISKSA